MSNKSKVTAGKFSAVKILLQSGATQRECAENMGLSQFTIGLIHRSESYEEYKNKAYVHSETYRKKVKKELAEKEAEANNTPAVCEKEPEHQEQPAQVVEYRQNITIQATHYMMEEMKKANELLTFISNKLAFIVEELTK